MLFVEPRFFAFFGVVMVLYWALLRRRRTRKFLLLGASYVFYAAWDWRFLGLIVLSTVVDYVVALRIEATSRPRRRRSWLWCSLAVNLGVLALFKYANFFVDSLQDTLSAIGLETSDTTLSITLPVGISFYTFQTLSYTIDVYRGTLAARHNLLDIATFVAFFPQLVAGPIVRAAEFLPQLDQRHQWREIPWRRATTLVVVGFTKKAVIADGFAPEVDRLFEDPIGHSTLGAIEGVIMYAAQIYGDFSGYSDMAIGFALMLGYSLGENFRWPYLSANITDFWRRWHISLSTWLRDYLYIGLGGNRRGPRRTQINLMITMLLGGLWHGASWTFVAWGGLHGLGLIGHRLWTARRTVEPGPEPEPRTWPVLATFGFVCAGWVLFRADSFTTALHVLAKAASFDVSGERAADSLLVLLVIAIVAHIGCGTGWVGRTTAKLSDSTYAAGLGVMLALAIALVPVGTRPFIYFQF